MYDNDHLKGTADVMKEFIEFIRYMIKARDIIVTFDTIMRFLKPGGS